MLYVALVDKVTSWLQLISKFLVAPIATYLFVMLGSYFILLQNVEKLIHPIGKDSRMAFRQEDALIEVKKSLRKG